MFKPLFIWGAGIRGEESKSLAYAEKYNIPIALTWGAIDLLRYNHRLNMGCFGTHGMRGANLAVQNASDICSFGCRLDTKATGTPKDFAPHARIFMIDIDQAEIDKMPKLGREVFGINTACKEVNLSFPERANDWLIQCQHWKHDNAPQGTAYDLMKKIGEYTNEKDIIVSDTGNTLGWIMQGFPFKGERFIHAFNFTPMGYGLGGAIGAAFAGNGARVVCIVGDGGALMSINELATIKRHNLPIKIILLNNQGHSMCRHTQRQWLGGKYYATSINGGLGFPNFKDTAEAFGIRVWNDDADEKNSIACLLNYSDQTEPGFLEVEMDPDESLAFQVKFGEALA